MVLANSPQFTFPSVVGSATITVYEHHIPLSLSSACSDYRIVGKMGEGTFSEVLRCQSHVDGKLYACKKMKQKYDR